MSIVLLGSTSGSCTLQEQAVAGTTTLTLPTFNGTVGLLVSGTVAVSTSGTSIDFTGIPATVRRITVMLNGVSTSGTSPLIVQLGDSGGVEITGYISSSGNIATATASVTSATTGFIVSDIAAASNTTSGIATIANITSNTWIASGTSKQSTAGISYFAGDKSLSSVLTTLRITTVNGTDTFDAGSINILYE
jgi:hypothetical protein